MKLKKVIKVHHVDKFGEILYILHKNNRKYLNDALDEYGMNLLQAMCLLIVNENDDVTQKDLTQALYLTKAGITKALTKLESEGYINKETSPIDKRQYILKLTKKGKDIIPTLQKINDDWEEKIGLHDLDSSFIETLDQLRIRSIELNSE